MICTHNTHTHTHNLQPPIGPRAEHPFRVSTFEVRPVPNSAAESDDASAAAATSEVCYGDRFILVDVSASDDNGRELSINNGVSQRSGYLGPRACGVPGEAHMVMHRQLSGSGQGDAREGDPVCYGDDGVVLDIVSSLKDLRKRFCTRLSNFKKSNSKTVGGYLVSRKGAAAERNILTFRIDGETVWSGLNLDREFMVSTEGCFRHPPNAFSCRLDQWWGPITAMPRRKGASKSDGSKRTEALVVVNVARAKNLTLVIPKKPKSSSLGSKEGGRGYTIREPVPGLFKVEAEWRYEGVEGGTRHTMGTQSADQYFTKSRAAMAKSFPRAAAQARQMADEGPSTAVKAAGCVVVCIVAAFFARLARNSGASYHWYYRGGEYDAHSHLMADCYLAMFTLAMVVILFVVMKSVPKTMTRRLASQGGGGPAAAGAGDGGRGSGTDAGDDPAASDRYSESGTGGNQWSLRLVAADNSSSSTSGGAATATAGNGGELEVGISRARGGSLSYGIDSLEEAVPDVLELGTTLTYDGVKDANYFRRKSQFGAEPPVGGAEGGAEGKVGPGGQPFAGLWAKLSASEFRVRKGPDYKRNRQKAPSKSQVYELVCCDLVRSHLKPGGVAKRVRFPEAVRKTIAQRHTMAKTAGITIPTAVVMTWECPDYVPANPLWGKSKFDGQSINIFYVFTLAEEFIKGEGKDDPQHDLWDRVCRNVEEDPPVRERMKLITTLGNPEALCTGSLDRGIAIKFNSTPCLVRPQHEFDTGTFVGSHHGQELDGVSYMEYVIDFHRFPYLARTTGNRVMGSMNKARVYFGVVVEARDDAELPERILFCAHLDRLQIETAKMWERDDLRSLRSDSDEDR